MSLTRAIAGNTAVQVAGRFIGTALGVLTVAVMTRHLGRAGYGEFTTVTSFLQFFGILVDFGLTLTMIRMISDADADEEKVASNIFTFRLVSGAAFFGAAAVIGLFFPYPATVKAGIALGSLSYFCISLSSVLIGVFQKKLAVARSAVAEIAGRALLFGGVVAVSLTGRGLMAIIAVLVLSNVVQLALCLVFVQRLTRVRPAFDLSLWREIFRQSWPLGVSVAFNLVYLKGDVIVMSLSRSQAEVGLYGASYKIIDVMTIIPMVFMGLVLPPLTAAWTSGDRASFVRRLGRAFDLMSLLAVPMVLGTLPLAGDLMGFVAGPDFAAAGPLLCILILAGAMVFWSALFGHAIVALGLQRKMIWGYAADAAVSLALYFLLIPRFGAPAAAWVTVFSEAFIAAATAVVVLRAAKAAVPLKTLGRSVLAAGIMYLALLGTSGLHVIWRVTLGIAVYFVFLFLFGGLPREIIEQLRRPKAA